MFVIDFEQVNAPKEAFNVITVQHLNTQSQQQNTRKKCEVCPRGKLFREKCLGEFHGGNFSEGGYFPEGNSLGVIVRG